MRLRIAAVVGSILAGCSPPSSTPPEPRMAQAVKAMCPDRDSAEYYFPEVSELLPGSSPPMTALERADLSEFLRQSGADSLSCGRSAEPAYRFIWRHSNRPVVIVSWHFAAEGWQAQSTVFNDPRDTHGPFFSPKVVATQSGSPAAERVSQVLQAIDAARFWTLAKSVRTMADDGASWVLEGRTGNGYRNVVHVNTQDKSILAIGIELMRLGDVEPPSEMLDLLNRSR